MTEIDRFLSPFEYKATFLTTDLRFCLLLRKYVGSNLKKSISDTCVASCTEYLYTCKIKTKTIYDKTELFIWNCVGSVQAAEIKANWIPVCERQVTLDITGLE